MSVGADIFEEQFKVLVALPEALLEFVKNLAEGFGVERATGKPEGTVGAFFEAAAAQTQAEEFILSSAEGA